MQRLLASLLLVIGLASPAFAQDGELYSVPDVTTQVPLEGDALRALFEDKLHRGYYDFLSKPDGEFSFTEMMNADGTTLHIRDDERSIGAWRIMSNVVCFRYENMGGGCFTLYRRGNCHYAYSVTAAAFIAVMVEDGETPSCEPSVA